ncbi:pyridoxal 5'-phosphate synthase glutaminase subunit PdxT [Klugiella xanthotipulae]|uniref:Pyridoxal 5'-phosphate synthase subunit PdxT n=1 Tax=Klugiella xanthotipulae TaxID=244735 RepID=A0A543HS97_9MICO|nr:pyridoxal 5'-phosphate synthase glutaminase subunit PdxT [Klugiella xanthotipulae]TQM61195.1 pyridoxal phosphate synthase yaaE subunit [Klugiella xanthotipulae]
MAGSSGPIGVLALQGDVREHRSILERLGAEVRLVRSPDDVAAINGLVIPGGESSVIDKLARVFGVREPLRTAIGAGLPVYGTCAGLILLADEVLDGIVGQVSFGGLDVSVRRNAFGSQADSFETELMVPVIGAPPMHAVFIRAPVVERVGPGVETIAMLSDGRVVAVRQGNILGSSFHPEMTNDGRFHRLFLDNVDRSQYQGTVAG